MLAQKEIPAQNILCEGYCTICNGRAEKGQAAMHGGAKVAKVIIISYNMSPEAEAGHTLPITLLAFTTKTPVSSAPHLEDKQE